MALPPLLTRRAPAATTAGHRARPLQYRSGRQRAGIDMPSTMAASTTRAFSTFVVNAALAAAAAVGSLANTARLLWIAEKTKVPGISGTTPEIATAGAAARLRVKTIAMSVTRSAARKLPTGATASAARGAVKATANAAARSPDQKPFSKGVVRSIARYLLTTRSPP